MNYTRRNFLTALTAALGAASLPKAFAAQMPVTQGERNDLPAGTTDSYHVGGAAFKPEGYNGSRRIVCFDKLFYNDNGTIKMVEQTTEKK